MDAHLLPHLLVGSEGAPRRLPIGLLALGWLVAVLALAGPVWERLPVPVFTVDAKRVILLDLSPSMNAADVPPSRLVRARFEVLDLLRASREGQVALVAYGPEPFVVSPLTGDAQTIADQVPRLTSDLIPVPGPRRTDRALEAAAELLAQGGAGPGEVILISDGVSAAASVAADRASSVAAARALAGAGHRVSVLAVGTPEGAPVPDAAGGFASDAGGAIPLSRLDRQGLEALARAGGGRYVEPDAGDQDTRALVDDSPRIESELVEQDGLTADQWREEGPWLLLALLPLAALAFRRGWLVPVLACAVLLPPAPGWALDWEALWQRADQRGARAYAAGDPAAAASTFQDPAWRAAARYRAGDYGGALGDLAGLAGPEADYNRGNALARQGELDDAIAAYERALEQAPSLEDAQANLELLRRLKEQQEQQEQQQQAQQQQEQQQQDPQAGSQEEQPPQGSQGGESQPSQERQGQASDQEGGHSDESQGGSKEESSEASQSQGEGQASGDDPGEGQPGAGTGPEDSELAESDSADGGRDPGAEPSAEDLGQDAVTGEPPPDLGPDGQEEGEPAGGRSSAAQGPEAEGRAAGGADLTPQERERQQALEAQLRRVPDDPAGLLRQRFILQHLRREGRLP